MLQCSYCNVFTIQNVPIKLKREGSILRKNKDLQYKMFLLNAKEREIQSNSEFIYNTKCSY